MLLFAEESAIEMSMKFSGFDLKKTCGGDNETICKQAVRDEIAKTLGIDTDHVQNLELKSGKNSFVPQFVGNNRVSSDLFCS